MRDVRASLPRRPSACRRMGGTGPLDIAGHGGDEMRRRGATIPPALLAAALALLFAAPAEARTSVPTIAVLSNRADLVSDGDALVRVTLPPGVRASRLRLTAGRRDVTRVLRHTGTRQLTGLVEGLAVGRVALVARIRGPLGSSRRRTPGRRHGPVVFTGRLRS